MPDGSVKSLYNPNSKWDWYEVGGRFCGKLFVKKNNTDTAQGSKSWVWKNKDPYECSYENLIKTDCARIKDLVFPTIETDKKQAEHFWELYIEGQNPKSKEDEELIKYTWYKKQYYIDHYKTKENYVRACSTFTTYAVITKNGVWHEQGQMGWWGMSSGDDEVGWADGYKSLVFDNAEDDDYITIVDCHI